jgi:hypothetical protein
MTWRGLVYRLREGGGRARFAGSVIRAFARLTVRRLPRIGLSAVVVGRNDDYMPDFGRRLHTSIAWNLKWLADEIVFVEWNPVSDRPLLAIGLAREFSRVRAFVVDSQIHQDLGGNAKVPVLEFHAKNVGIRRSSQEWILTTNADALVGPDTTLRVRGRSLSPDVVLTAQRIDIPWREQRSRPASVLDTLWYRRVIPDHSLGTGEFLLAHRRLWQRAGGYDESSVRHRIGIDKRGTAQLIARGGQADRAGLVFHLVHPTSCTEGIQEHHGEWAGLEGVPYASPPSWGLEGRTETPLAERVWLVR